MLIVGLAGFSSVIFIVCQCTLSNRGVNNPAKDVMELVLPMDFMPAISLEKMLRDVLGSDIVKRYSLIERPIVNTETRGPQVYLVQDFG